MSADVVDLEKYRQRRHWRNLSESIRTGVDWPEPTVASPAAHLELEGYDLTYEIVDETHLWERADLSRFRAVIDDDVRQLAVLCDLPRWFSPGRRGPALEPGCEILDETPWLTVDDIARRVDAGLADPSPMRRAFLNATASSDPEAMRRVLLDAKAALDAASTLPGIRPGSDDGDAEGQPRDPEVPRS